MRSGHRCRRRRCRPRRGKALVAAVSLTVLPSAFSRAATPPAIVTGGLPIGLETLTTTGGPPLALDYAPGDATGRLFIAGQTNGHVELWKSGGAVQPTPFLNFSTAGIALSSGSEKGLLGIAFHPNYNATVGTPGRGLFYTYSSEAKAATVDFAHPELGGVSGSGGDHDSVVREWTVANPATDDTVNYAAPSRVVMRIREPQSNHNGGALRFGPDANLYIALGDGGGGNDQNAGDNASLSTDGHTTTTGNGQDLSNVFGKLLRINPLDPDGAGPAKYSVPASNPFVGTAGAVPEIYAYGLRNPFRFSFDRVGAALMVGDVGQTAREEVDIVTAGQNYGWVFREGTLTNSNPGQTQFTPTQINRTPPAGYNPVDPIAEYTHADGQAIIGGHVYRGVNIPELYGKYIFGELGRGNPSIGRLFYTDATQTTPGVDNTINEFTYAFTPPSGQLYSFGEDKDGEIYAMFANGVVAKLLGRQWLTQGGGSWNTGGNWLLGTGEGVPNAAGASANFLGRIPAAATVTLDGSKTVGAVRFNNAAHGYTIAPGTGGTLTLDTGSGVTSSLIQVIRGNHTINVPLSIPLARPGTIDTAAGTTLTLGGSLTVGGSVTLTKSGAGTAVSTDQVTFNPGAAATTLSVTGGNFVLAPGSPSAVLRRLSFSGGGRLDITNNAAVFKEGSIGTWNGSTYTGITGQIRSGRNTGAWDGSGIITSQTTATTSNLTSIGIATAAQVKGITGTQTAVWAGQTVIPGNTLVMYTYGGDANLDGKINVDDYGRIDLNANLGTGGWYNGDFNYDGKVNVDDYGIIDFNVGIQGAPLPTASLPLAGFADRSASSAVPEPAILSLVVLAPLALRRRRSVARICSRWTST